MNYNLPSHPGYPSWGRHMDINKPGRVSERCKSIKDFIVNFCISSNFKKCPRGQGLFIHSQSSQRLLAVCISRSDLQGQTATKPIWGTKTEHTNKQLCLCLSVSLPHTSLYVTGRNGAQTNLTHLSFELSEKSQSSYFQLSMFFVMIRAILSLHPKAAKHES